MRTIPGCQGSKTDERGEMRRVAEEVKEWFLGGMF